LCTQTINVYGDHATCSKPHCHNAMRNLVNEIAEDGLLSPVEKKGILGSTLILVVTIPLWEKESKSPARHAYRKHAK